MATGQILRGWVGQRLDGRKVFSGGLLAHFDDLTGSGAFTATRNCLAVVRAWGAGGAGGSDSTLFRAAGGGGGGAGYKVVRMGAGQILRWSVGLPGTSTATPPDGAGNAGGDTIIVLPTGISLIASGGKGGPNGGSNTPGGVGGQPVGAWDLARSGGAGGQDGPSSTAGSSPLGGGLGGAFSGGYGGGGAPAGFSDIQPGVLLGNGGGGGGAAPGFGGGSGGSSPSLAGGTGRVIVIALVVH